MSCGFLRKTVLCGLCLGEIFLTPNLPALDFQARPSAGYLSAQFRYWQPPVSGLLQGVLVLLPAYNTDGLALADDPNWQAVASNLHLGLISCYYQQDNKSDYSRAELGSGQALIDALRYFSDSTKNRDLFLLKFILVGSSSGGQFAYSFAQYQSPHTLAFVCVNGAYFTSFATGSGWHVPGAFLLDSSKDQKLIQSNTEQWSKARHAGGLWSLGEAPGLGIDDSAVRHFIETFASDALAARLLTGNPLGGLKSISELDGWAAPMQGGALIEGRNLKRSESSTCSWFPGRSSAEAWLKVHQPISPPKTSP